MPQTLEGAYPQKELMILLVKLSFLKLTDVLFKKSYVLCWINVGFASWAFWSRNWSERHCGLNLFKLHNKTINPNILQIKTVF